MQEWHVSAPRKENVNGMKDVVTSVFLSLYEKIGDTVVQGWHGRVYLNPPDPASFTDFDSLTKDQVLGWAKNILGAHLTSKEEASLAEAVSIRQEWLANVAAMPDATTQAPSDFSW